MGCVCNMDRCRKIGDQLKVSSSSNQEVLKKPSWSVSYSDATDSALFAQPSSEEQTAGVSDLAQRLHMKAVSVTAQTV